MCGRYTLTVDKGTIEKRFGVKFYIATASYDWEPTYNAAPSQMLPIIRTYATTRIELAQWPEEWKRSTRMRPQINARLETAAEKPMFASSYSGRHCMVLADGYYDWRTVGNRKQPYRITLKTGEPFAMAGIYAREPTEFDTAEKNPVNFAILTTKANDAVSYIHDRMPIILPLGRKKLWLPPDPSGIHFVPPFPAALLTSYPVTPKMNKASFDETRRHRPTPRSGRCLNQATAFRLTEPAECVRFVTKADVPRSTNVSQTFYGRNKPASLPHLTANIRNSKRLNTLAS
jgi:putative SOS response-associated peptidase YedK